MHPLAQRVLDYIRREDLIHAGHRVGVAVSGGVDSVALLRLLIELKADLGIVVSVLHFNHKLRGAESDSDQRFVAELAHAHELQFHSGEADVSQYAADEHVSIEAAARRLRCDFFEHKLGAAPAAEITLDKIATGHTMDDQAETVLLRVIRGTGMRGLRAIQPRIPVHDVAEELSGEIIRPLLEVRRREVEQYLGSLGQPWREDATNADPRFTRNRARHVLLPLIESEFNPAVAENLAELAEIARGEEDYWEGEASGWMGTAVQWLSPEWAKGLYPASQPVLVQLQASPPPAPDLQLNERMQEPGPPVTNASISLGWYLSEPIAVQRRVTKAVADSLGLPLEFKHIDAIVQFAAEQNSSGKRLALPLGWTVVRERDALVFVTPDLRVRERVPDYEYVLTVPGRTVVPEIYSAVEALLISAREREAYDPDQLFDPGQLGNELRVRNWRSGDRFWPAHTKAPKKLKELLQEKHISQWQKKFWPVMLSGSEIAWVRGFPGPAQYRPAEGQDAIVIREVPLEE